MQNYLTGKIKEKILSIEHDAVIILYGSRARKDYRETSDWDYLILINGVVNSARIDRIRSALYEIEVETDQIINSIIRSREEWESPKYSVLPFHKNIEREGIRI
ncbi:MAG: nucleotidyltransferase domain-containing protein [Spirochaetota bacterium]